jgi:hypothetical protein
MEKMKIFIKKLHFLRAKKSSENFIVSDQAVLENEKGNLSFKLINGKSFCNR